MFNSMSGVKPSGTFHIGNYVSTIKPIVDNSLEKETLFLIADGHSLTSRTKNILSKRLDIAKILYSFGITNIVYQSWFPEVFELAWVLSNYTSKGLMNRAHAFKTARDFNIDQNNDPDKNINMGLYNYPILMASDLVLFECKNVFVGYDQLQHIEMAKEIVDKFNYYNGNLLSVPTPIIKSNNTIPGYDGRKMSKSYGNIIPLMCNKKKLKKNIFSIKTNSKNIGETKHWDDSPITELYQVFANDNKCNLLKEEMILGMGWGEVKSVVFEEINKQIENSREIYNELTEDIVNDILLDKYNKIKNGVHFKMNNQIKRIIYKGK